MSIVSTLGFVALVTLTPAAHAEINNTNTNTENQQIQLSFDNINSDPLSLDAFKNQDELALIRQAALEKESAAYQKVMNTWKKKQAHLWEQLPDKPFTINATAYTASADECGNDKGITASGVKVQEKRTIACPANYPFGAQIYIEGYGLYTCEDRGGAIVDNHIDVYVQTKAEAFQFGRRHLVAQVVK